MSVKVLRVELKGGWASLAQVQALLVQQLILLNLLRDHLVVQLVVDGFNCLVFQLGLLLAGIYHPLLLILDAG